MRHRRTLLGGAAVVAVVVVAAVGMAAAARTLRSPSPVLVRPGESVVAAATPGGVVELAPGRHGSFTLAVPATVRGRDGAVVEGGVRVTADRARLEHLRVEGGSTGVEVRDATHVVLDGVVVRGADLHGIDVNGASATIRGCDVAGLRSPYAQAVEVRHTLTLPRVVVEGCRVRGGQEGIVSHLSRLEIRGNTVTGTTMRGIAVTEMSEGLVEGNTVHGVAGAGIYCGDMAHCEVRGNAVRDVAPGPDGNKSHAGQGVVVWYHSTARVHDNVLDVDHVPAVHVMDTSRAVDHFPLSVWPPGWRGGLPAVPVSALALAATGAVALVADRVLRGRVRARPVARAATSQVLLAGILGGFAVQAFHMLEHVVQIWQTYVAEAEERSGLLGRSVDTEWVHFVFNASVLAFLVLVAWAARPTGLLAHRAAAWLTAAVAVQGYHVVEHTAKVLQHEVRGIRTAPGLIGDDLGLVWFHYGINLAVSFATAMAVLAMVRAARRPAEAPAGLRGRAPLPA